MKTCNHSFDYLVYDSEETLDPADRDLLNKARLAAHNSHAPYSRYHVGAALLLNNGIVFQGSNQENIAFPAGICAERAALFAAMSSCPEQAVDAIAITAMADDFEVTEPVPPCGICRQAIMEYEIKFARPVRLILGGASGKVFVVDGMNHLLPLAFLEKGLRKSNR